jgi:ribose 5-phosphate isomerase B
MKIYLATDHAGFELKNIIKTHLESQKYEVIDCGAETFDKNDDFVEFIARAAENVSKEPESKAIIFGGSGQGEAIVANKFNNVRAVVFYGPVAAAGAIDASGAKSTDTFEIIKLSRIHNNANVLSFGARFVTKEDAIKAVDIWLTTQFSGEERHKRRIEKITQLEKTT